MYLPVIIRAGPQSQTHAAATDTNAEKKETDIRGRDNGGDARRVGSRPAEQCCAGQQKAITPRFLSTMLTTLDESTEGWRATKGALQVKAALPEPCASRKRRGAQEVSHE